MSVENWRDVADLGPRDDQRACVAALAARYLLLGVYGDTCDNLGVYDGEVVMELAVSAS